ncbi:hypothetical protein [Brevibacillus centrosporus]|uniref:hypothetical protein n=1 Tax=Brevibacillus centrosporus TaxID=54910 RepID=UPI0037FB5F2F
MPSGRFSSYTFNFFDNVLPDVIILLLTDQSGIVVFTATIIVVPDEQLLVSDCVTFGDIVISSP